MFDDYQRAGRRHRDRREDARRELCRRRHVRLVRSGRRPTPNGSRDLVSNPRASKVVVYTWNFAPELIISAQDQGVHGYLSKTLPARELVAALERIHAGEQVVSEPAGRIGATIALDWPGRKEGISDRESEILALITQGKDNSEVAALTYLSPNTIKSYIRSIYRKIGVTSRTQAVLWGVKHGFMPDFHRIDNWRGVS